MKYISICSGIEAATMAFHGFGWTPLAFSEIEAFPSAVLSHHWPDVPNLGDMTKYEEWPEEILAECDLLVGGPPCQAFSVAGLRKSLDDDRGNITLAYVRLLNHIDAVRRSHGRPPAIALYENVPGLLSTKDNAFGCLIGALCGCDEAPETEAGKWPKAGFLCGETRRVGYRVLDAQYFGVAQRRRRIFLVAVPGELVERLGERACPSEILSLRSSMRGNPPTRSKAWEGVARATASGLTSSGRGVERCGESRGQDDVVISVPDVANSLTAFGGNKTSGPLDVATSCLAHGGPHGRQDFASETFVCHSADSFAFKPSHFTRGKDGKPDSATPPLSADADKGDQDIVIFTGDGVIADPISAHEARTYTHEGTTFRLHNCVAVDTYNQTVGETSIPVRVGNAKDSLPAVMVPVAQHGICATGTTAHSLTTRAAVEEDGTGRGTPIVPVAFVKATNPHSKEEAPRFEEASVAACLNGWDERHDPPKHVVAFTQNQREEVRDLENVATACSAEPGTHQQTYVAFKESQSGCRVGDVHATIDANKGSRRQEGVVAFAQNQISEVRVNADVMGTVNTNQNASGRNTPMVASAMQVRRLTPTECCRLQGFPDNHCDIVFRKKPAADGPKYRALGNSMAVPCMMWLGYRIHEATK